MPASYRTKVGDLIHLCAAERQILAFLKDELELHRLTSIFDWLWIAGRPMPPRPLHHQLMLGRNILITEDMSLHLVWATGRIFLKPVPRFLLGRSFWAKYLTCPQLCLHGNEASNGEQENDLGCRLGLRRLALGFLASYTALVSHESDFFIAKEKHLLPDEVEWQAWRSLVWEILGHDNIDDHVDARFLYGELRLGRLNKIYMFSGRSLLRGYMPTWQHYGAYFQDNFNWLASATVYIAIVLTAMQVGLATSLEGDPVFQSASRSFTIFSILGPLIVAGLILFVFILMFIDNLAEAVRYKKKRFGELRARDNRS